jgi:sugar/nucleoside kinase (ribokinase family)
MQYLRVDESAGYRQLIGVGGVGAGIFFELEANSTLGRNESRLGRLLDVRDYCKLHIIIHYVAKLLGAGRSEEGFRVVPVAKVGDDAPGQRVLREMTEIGIDVSRVQTIPGSPTLFSVCFQYPDGCGGNITTNNSAASLLSEADVDALEDVLRAGGRRGFALAAPEIPLNTRRHFLELASRSGAFRAASFAAAEVKAARDTGVFDLLDLVSLNENEGEELVDCTFSDSSPEEFLHRCQELLRQHYPKMKLIVSAGRLGAFGITAGEYQFCPAPSVRVASTAGAGDSLLGGALAALTAGIPFVCTSREEGKSPLVIDSAVALGVLLGSYKCLSPHTIHPDANLQRLVAFAREKGLKFAKAVEETFTDEAAISSAHSGGRDR